MVELTYFVRVVFAALCGITIGFERKNRAKEAGIRTHCIVAATAALIMIVSKYAFFDLIADNPYPDADIRLDPSRVASTIVSGIGFIGAGMIFVHRETIKGLTTAAGIWATSGIGMAIGAGMYLIGFLVTVFIVCIQVLLHKDNKFLAVPHYKEIFIKNVDKKGFQKEFTDILHQMNISIEDIQVSYNSTSETYNYTFSVEMPASVSEEDIINSIKYDTLIETSK